MARQLTLITSGEWQKSPYMTDFRSEWLSGVLVERAMWQPDAPIQRIGATITAAPGHVWFRFWLQEIEQVVEKYFDVNQNSVGILAPICANWRRRDARLVAPSMLLGLWIDKPGRVTVLNEELFDHAAQQGDLTPVEVEHAEQRIRELTTAVNQKRFPPAIVKNLTIDGALKKT